VERYAGAGENTRLSSMTYSSAPGCVIHVAVPHTQMMHVADARERGTCGYGGSPPLSQRSMPHHGHKDKQTKITHQFHKLAPHLQLLRARDLALHLQQVTRTDTRSHPAYSGKHTRRVVCFTA
jgi:hypothetical protein